MANLEVVGIDRADDDHELVADRLASHGRELTPAGDGRAAGRAHDTNRVDIGTARYAAEDRDRFVYLDDLRSADSPALEGAARDGWDSAVLRFREKWAEHQERWPASTRHAADWPDDPPGSWRGDSGRYLDPADNAEVERRCERVAEAERTTISPAMRAIEAADPTRELVGWEHRLKGADRIKDKVAADMNLKGRNVQESFAGLKDSLRYTFRYEDACYSEGVHADIDRLKGYGFQEIELRNSWASDQYKGINSRWFDPGTGAVFELQFHTRTSHEYKELTHGVYERLRSPVTIDPERDELDSLQRDACGHVTIPPGATDISDHPEEHQWRKRLPTTQSSMT